ncbi:MAG: hypothetical protein ACNA8W_16765, partial [Bradymonadaceae bacterium]
MTPDPSSPSMLRRLSPLLAAGFFVFAGVLSIVLQLFVFPGSVKDEDWQRAAAHVVEAIEREDVVRVHPTWNEDALPYLTHVGNQLHRHHIPFLEDVQHIDRIWIVSETKRLDEAYSQLPFEADSVEVFPFGTVTVALVDVPDWVQARYILHDELAGAIVTRTR